VTTGQDSRVFVEAAARLHFGVLDLRGSLGRWFGGIGAAASAPTVLLSASRADSLAVDGQDAGRAQEFARRFLDHYGIRRGAEVHVHRALPAHAGLGSGTQLALAVARALAELYEIAIDAPGLARAVGRARRSAIGTWTFDKGGLVVEGGRLRDGATSGPLIARLPFPADWRCVVAVPESAHGLSGPPEEEAFAQLPLPPEPESERVSHLVLMGLLPALADGDLPAFGSALTQIQEMTGRWFATVQGSTFAPGPSEELIRRMTELGACGVGQSSWGPTVYGIVRGEEAAHRLADQVREALGTTGAVYEGPFRGEGARVWKGTS
jgi:beta-ribofuranosylaminobenzene 5'-phosphate synthase